MIMKLQNTQQKTVLFQNIDWVPAFAGMTKWVKPICTFHIERSYVNGLNKTATALFLKQKRLWE
jgi:hypothetical protein